MKDTRNATTSTPATVIARDRMKGKDSFERSSLVRRCSTSRALGPATLNPHISPVIERNVVPSGSGTARKKRSWKRSAIPEPITMKSSSPSRVTVKSPAMPPRLPISGVRQDRPFSLGMRLAKSAFSQASAPRPSTRYLA